MPVDLERLIAQTEREASSVDLERLIALAVSQSAALADEEADLKEMAHPVGFVPRPLQVGYIKPFGAKPGFSVDVETMDGRKQLFTFHLVPGAGRRQDGTRTIFGTHSFQGFPLWGAQPGEVFAMPGYGRVRVVRVRHSRGAWVRPDVERYYKSFPHLADWLAVYKKPSLRGDREELPIPPPSAP